MTDIKYKLKILELSDALVEAQRPIRILDSIKWGEDIDLFLLKTQFKEMPKIDHQHYLKKSLKFNPFQKIIELQNLKNKIKFSLGKDDVVAKILVRNCEEYENVVRMLLCRGTPDFYEFSKKLYGHPSEKLEDGQTFLSDLGILFGQILSGIEGNVPGEFHEKNLSGQEVVNELQQRLGSYFSGINVNVKLADGIISDASAGADYIKIKNGPLFSKRDVDIFEVHEGWVHLGTTINGQRQTYAQWLSKGPPCSTVTQEGLAVLMEVFNFAIYPERAKRLNNRLKACQMAEDGANLLEVIHYFLNTGLTHEDALKNAGRIFRGADVHGSYPFTKDISYLKGFIQIYNFLRNSIRQGRPEMIPYLFAGKVTLEDVPVLYELSKDGIVDAPLFLPKQFKDLNGLAVWMALSSFLNKMKLEEMSENKKIKLVA